MALILANPTIQAAYADAVSQLPKVDVSPVSDIVDYCKAIADLNVQGAGVAVKISGLTILPGSAPAVMGIACKADLSDLAAKLGAEHLSDLIPMRLALAGAFNDALASLKQRKGVIP